MQKTLVAMDFYGEGGLGVNPKLLSFSKDLHAACRAHRVRLKRVCELPEEWRVGRFVVAVDRQRDRALIRFARNPVAKGLPCDVAGVLAACSSALTRLQRRSIDPDHLLPMLAEAYRELAPAGSGRPRARVARVALVDVLTHLKLKKRDYTRAQFVFDLVRLKSERRLVFGDERVDFGIATGRASSKRSRVLWIEDETGAGHYFQTFRMLPYSVEEQ